MSRILSATIFAILAALLLIFLAQMEIVKMAPAGAPDSLFRLPLGDFSDLWSAGVLARAGRLATLYDPVALTAWKAHAFGHPVTSDPWIYPPVALPLGSVLSFLPVAGAFVVWSLGTVTAMVVLLRRSGLPWMVVWLSLVCPAALLSLIYGQYGGIIGALAFTALAAPGKRGGFCLGLCLIKPQTVLLVPLALLTARRWTALLTAALTAMVLAALPLVFGIDAWLWFFTKLSHAASVLLTAPFGQGYQLAGTSVFWLCRSFGAGVVLSYAAQAASAAAAALATVLLWRGPLPVLEKTCLTLLLGLLVAPYGFSADMEGYGIAIAVLTWRRGAPNVLDGLFYLWPGYAPLATAITGHCLTPLVVAGLLALSWLQCARRSAVPGPRLL
jgi:hypothetical protein